MKTGAVLFIGASAVLLCSFAAYSADVKHGREVYAQQKCVLCHSIAGVGNKKTPLDGVGSKLNAEQIKKWIKSSKETKPDTKMKAYPNLPEGDLDDLTAFILSLK